MGILKTGMLSAIVAGTAMFASAKPADAQIYFGIGTGGYYSPGYSFSYGQPSYGNGYSSYGYTPYHGGSSLYGNYGRNNWDRGWNNNRWDDGDYRRAHRELERDHRQFHRRWDRGHDWDD